MKVYRWTICEPDHPEVIEKGMISGDDILQTFLQYPWKEKLKLLNSLPEDKICFSPSIEFEDSDAGHGVTFSCVGDETDMEFYIFYKRDKMVSNFGGLFNRQVKGKISDITGQGLADAQAFLEAFLKNDTAYLEQKISGT